MKIKDLKITYNTLCELDYPVDEQLLKHLSQQIRTTESRQYARKLSKMTEEQLIHETERKKRTLRIYTADGRLIQKPKSEATYRTAIQHYTDVASVAALGLRMGHKEVIRRDTTMLRKRLKNYFYLQPGFFLLDVTSTAERYSILKLIDERLHLNWEVELA